MKKLNRQQEIVIIILMLALCIAACAGILEKLYIDGEGEDEQEILLEFSHGSGFYEEPFVLELWSDKEVSVYYTLDGSLPDRESGNGFLYENGIPIRCYEGETVSHVNCIAYSKDGTASPVYTRTFLTGTGLADRYEIPVLSVYGDPEELFGYESGIFVDGKLGDEYLEENPQLKESTLPENQIAIYGNRYQQGRQGERRVSMTLFDRDGKLLLSQGCGLRLFGNMSRQKNHPSFRLYARTEYDAQNRFNYILFPDQDACGNTLTGSLDRITVRNGGTDNGYAFVRSELAEVLSDNAGFPDTQNARAVCVYVNGQYYGAYWFITTFDEDYFRSTYGDYPGEIYVYEGKLTNLTPKKEGEPESYGRLAEEYNSLYKIFVNADMNLDENWEALGKFMDVDNFLQYLAILNYIGNSDSLQNNFKVYRYYSEDGEYQDQGVFDGRYRFLLFDLDFSLGLEQVILQTGAIVSRDNLGNLIGGLTDEPEMSELVCTVLDRREAQEQYIRYTLALANYYFAKEQAEPVLDEMFGSIEKELRIMYETPGMMDGNFLAPETADYAFVEDSVQKIRHYLEYRPGYVLDSLQNAFGEMTPYTLSLENDSQAIVSADCVTLQDREYKGTYFKEVPVTISAVPRPGYVFKGWIINGEIYTEPEMVLDASWVQGEALSAVCVCEPDDGQDLCITSLKTKGLNDYIVLTNLGQEDRNLRDYYLTDDPENWNQCTLPGMEVPAGGSVTVYCKNYTGADALGQPGVNFSIKEGETVCLYGKDGTRYSCVPVPELGSKEGVYTLDLFTGEYKEIIP